MLVKLHSTEMTAQRLSINLRTLTSRCCFGPCSSLVLFALFRNRSSVCIRPLVPVEPDGKRWKEGVVLVIVVVVGGVGQI